MFAIASLLTGSAVDCDLYPESMWIIDHDSIYVVIANRGRGRCGGFCVDAWVDAPAPPAFGDHGDGYAWIGRPSGLLPGTLGVELTLPSSHLTSVEAGYWVDIIVDTDEQIEEGDDANNAWSFRIDPAWFDRANFISNR